jgi:hypothetical protein
MNHEILSAYFQDYYTGFQIRGSIHEVAQNFNLLIKSENTLCCCAGNAMVMAGCCSWW